MPSFSLPHSQSVQMVTLYPVEVWVCCCTTMGQWETFLLPLGRAAADPMGLFGSASPPEVVQNQIDKSSKRMLFAVRESGLGSGISLVSSPNSCSLIVPGTAICLPSPVQKRPLLPPPQSPPASSKLTISPVTCANHLIEEW